MTATQARKAVRLLRRPPRLRQLIAPVTLTLPAVPVPPRPYPRAPLARVLLMSLLPALLPPAVLAAATYLAGADTSTVITSSALAGSLGLAVIITTLLSRRDEDARLRSERQMYEEERAGFEDDVAALADEARQAVARERAILEREYPAPDTLLAYVQSLSSMVWKRRLDDDDFLDLRLGIGDRPTCIRFEGESRRSGDSTIAALRDEAMLHHGAPVTWHLVGSRTGIFGDADRVDGLVRGLIAQAAALHAPGDLRLAVLTRDDGLRTIAKWLPHATNGITVAVAADDQDAVGLLARARAAQGAAGESAPQTLVLADTRGWPSLAALLEPLAASNTARLAIVQCEERYERLIGACDAVLDLRSLPARLQLRASSDGPQEFVPDALSHADALMVALCLAPLALDELSSRSPVPDAVRMTALLPGADDPRRVLNAWNAARDAFALRAPIGLGPGGVPVEVDLRRDGPHAVIAGTTGSGKSELLQSLVVSFAVRIPPDLLNFLLFDYKGGSAFADVERLPHVVGIVTDLDERLSERALVSLRAELRRREQLLAEVGAANIAAYQAIARRVPLANLVIIIDEFHRLVSEMPEFIDQMVLIAQQGRSLGVHLLLSTQKPSGVISEHIRANTNLRICLRVTDEADSRDVLGAPDAAAIPRGLPGRLYLRRGSDALEVCQAGRVSGARERVTEIVAARPFYPPLTTRVTARGAVQATLGVEGPRDAPPPPDEDERAVVVAAMREAAARMRLPQQSAPWQPYLPERLSLAELQQQPDDEGLAVSLGIVDEPERQAQSPLCVDAAAGHICVAGAGDTGKTTALLALASAVATTYPTERCHLYGLDFAGGALAPLADLPHCGGVAAQHQPAAVAWVVRFLQDVVQQRLAGQPTHTGAHILVLVDNMNAFVSWLAGGDGGVDAVDRFIELLDIGRAVGVTCAFTTERPEAVRSAILALVHQTITFRLSDADGYRWLGLRAGRPPSAVPGRALVSGAHVHEAQIAVPARASDLLLQGPSPLPIAPLPVDLPYEHDPAAARGALRLGLREGLAPAFEVPQGRHLLIAGPRGSGRSNALAVIVHELAQQPIAPIYVFSPRRSPLLRAACSGRRGVALFEGWGSEQAGWEQVALEMSRRLALLESDGAPFPWAVIVDDATLVELPPDASAVLEQLIQRGDDIAASVFAAVEPRAAAYTYGPLRSLAADRTGLLLRPATTEDFDLFGVHGRPARLPVGRGYWCEAGERHAVQVFRFGETGQRVACAPAREVSV